MCLIISIALMWGHIYGFCITSLFIGLHNKEKFLLAHILQNA